ncbi:aldo/keto reductase [Nonomuraea sp. bgisy101]|uniref:aldo/keto reductase n=1 Tax=Nonomuraea sp. bgisy101 TaxID=3413784 RepID=UPI003D7511E2
MGQGQEQRDLQPEAAWEAGIRLFDTAPHYGLGLSERRLGAFLASKPRESFTLSTKVGRLLVPAEGGGRDDQGFDVPADHRRVWDFSAEGVRRSLGDSLDRLGLSSIDIALVHDPDDQWQQAVDEAVPALLELRDQGVVKGVGVGMNRWQPLARAVRETDVDLVMLAGRYTLLDQSAEAELLTLCLERGVSVLAAGVFNSGLLATHDPQGTYDYAPASDELLKRARRIAAVCEGHGVTLPQAALAFPLRHPAVTSVVVGVRSVEEVRRNAALVAAPVPDRLWDELAEERLLGGTAVRF